MNCKKKSIGSNHAEFHLYQVSIDFDCGLVPNVAQTMIYSNDGSPTNIKRHQA